MYTVYAQVFNVATEQHELRPILHNRPFSQALDECVALADYGSIKTCVYDPNRQCLYIADGFTFYTRLNVPVLPQSL